MVQLYLHGWAGRTTPGVVRRHRTLANKVPQAKPGSAAVNGCVYSGYALRSVTVGLRPSKGASDGQGASQLVRCLEVNSLADFAKSQKEGSLAGAQFRKELHQGTVVTPVFPVGPSWTQFRQRRPKTFQSQLRVSLGRA